MKQITIALVLFAVVALGTTEATAQRRRMPPPEGPRSMMPERVDKFRKMRMIEMLKLEEEDAVRFFAKQSAHEDVMGGLMKSRNEALDDLEELIKDEKGENKEAQALAENVLDADQKIFGERQRFQAEIRKLLTAEQFGKFLIFERNFGRQIRDAMQEMGGEHKRRERLD